MDFKKAYSILADKVEEVFCDMLRDMEEGGDMSHPIHLLYAIQESEEAYRKDCKTQKDLCELDEKYPLLREKFAYSHRKNMKRQGIYPEL